jgi:uncharacterized protein
MKTNTSNIIGRITVVDALRGFAIMSIMLLHNLEHFDFYFTPEGSPAWLKALDVKIWDTMFFLFSGKSYAIFALLFGFTFYIMDSNQQSKGLDFRARFLWRMALLLGFGIINSIFFEGDILAFYAVLGISLVLVNKLSNKVVLLISIFLILQPFEIARFIYELLNPAYTPGNPASWQYFGKQGSYIPGDSFFNTAIGNLINGRLAVTLWTWEVGRCFQAPSLFMLGMLLGRKGLFVASDKQKKFWSNVLIIAAISFSVIYIYNRFLPKIFSGQVLNNQVGMIIGSLSNVAFMLVMVSVFILLFQRKWGHKLLTRLETFGKMSLTNYVMQSIMGAWIYYGFGLGLYKYTGATYCFLIGIVLFTIQLWFCKWWLSTHNQGPLEAIWHKLTWVKFKKIEYTS